MLLKEGQVRIPAGCAISGIFHKDGKRENGENIIRSIATMHDRSNGLGGGFAAYGIYPEYKDDYAFHVFFDDERAKDCLLYTSMVAAVAQNTVWKMSVAQS